MKLIEVIDKKQEQRFLDMVTRIYKGENRYIRPMDRDLNFVFDRQKNKQFSKGDAIRWILEDEKGQPIGRIAAFYEEVYAQTAAQPTGGFGFFECIDDQEAANMLLGAARKWLETKGMEAMDGPINFGDKRAWWGLLIMGFYEPTYQLNYNHPYYQKLLENFGAQIYYKQVVFQRDITEPAPPDSIKCLNELRKDPGYTFDYLHKNNLEKYARDFAHIFNNSWGKHEGFSPVDLKTVLKGFQKAKPILHENLMIFGYYKGEAISFFLMIPDINPIIRKFNGKMGLWQKIQLKYHLMRQTYPKCFGQTFGVVPEHQGTGADLAIVAAAAEFIHPDPKNRYAHMEMTWIGDWNPKMLAVAKKVGGVEYKNYATFRYLFDRTKPFHRHPIIGVSSEEAS